MPNGSAQEWEENWRRGVNTKLDTLLDKVEGFGTRLTVVENGQNDLRAKPANLRDWAGVWVLVVGLLVTFLCGASGFVLSLIQILAAHWH